ncbi:GT4 family glycosyltransferase PelF [Gorillibacterium sp. sgz5001074]|uniref:GT4 family glycosyltransferase PelF n=1 Tax=Gorillibacterium sp. sgz5001074 TaxID=3446695 RepID=UPI003F67A24E
MRICLIAEGSYPYVTGGVSGWIQSLVTSMPEHEFILYAIGAEAKLKGVFKYKIPENLVEIHEVFLDSYLREEGAWGKRFRIKKSERQALYDLLSGNQTSWRNIFSLLSGRRFEQVSDFLMSKDFFDLMYEVCDKKYTQVPYTEMFWTVRSMILPLFYIIRNPMPPADLYHAVSTGYSGVIGSLGKFMYEKPFLLTEHGIYSREREEEIIKADWIKGYFKDMWIHYFFSLSQCAYESADQVVSLFHRNKEIQEELGCEGHKITIIPNGVEASDYASLPSGEDKLEGWVYVGAVVRVVPIKDIKTMLQSFSVAKHSMPNIKLFIFGPVEEDLEYYEECRQLVAALELKDVQFTGTVNIKEWIGRMDLLLLTSISEGQPLALLEGMACGKPFVTTDVGSCRELIYGKDDPYGEAGIVAPVMNAERIGDAIVKLCRNPELRVKMGRNGLERVKALYGKKAFIESYRQLYHRMGGDADGRDRI